MSKQNLDDLIEASEEAISKGEDLSDFDAEHHHKVKEEHKSKDEKIAEKIKEKRYEKKEAENSEEVAEATDEAENNSAVTDEEGEDKKKTAKKEKDAPKKKAKVRSKSYQEVRALVEPQKRYDLDEALELVKKVSMTKFDGNIELHVRLLGKSGKPEQVRGMINYPHSTGKKVNVVILDEKMIEEIAATKKIEADIYLATPALMPKIARLAKILGPKGKMPNPKAGTISADPEKTKADLEAGQAEYKTDSYGNVHQVIGKVSGNSEELKENYNTLINALPKEKIVTIVLCPTMGPSVKVQK